MKVAGRIFIIFYRVVVSAVVAAAAAVLVLFLFGIRPYAVRTGSMEPTIPQGSLSFVNTRAPFEEVKEKDIIAFKVGEVLVTHRAKTVDGDRIITQGDANNNPDAVGVRRNNYIGETLFWIPVIGKVPLFAHTPGGKIVLIAGFALFLLTGILYDRISVRMKQKRNSEEENTVNSPRDGSPDEPAPDSGSHP